MRDFIIAGLLLCALSAAAEIERSTLIRAATLHAQPAADSEKVARVERGRGLVILERKNIDGEQPWFKVLATVADGAPASDRKAAGWLSAQGIVSPSTPDGDRIIYGEALDSEGQAEARGGRKGAAEDAARLYLAVAELFPRSSLAPEALWRSADIRWQLERASLRARPSARELDPDARTPMDERLMKRIIEEHPRTRWADLAAYEMIDNRLCGEWMGSAKCPEMESRIYEEYFREHPRSPKAAEALYNAAWRQAVLADIYKIDDRKEMSAAARAKGLALARELAKVPGGPDDWTPRALDLAYKLEQGTRIYGAADD